MKALREFTRNVKPLWDLVDKVCRFPLTQAVYVEPEPLWQWSWRLARAGGRSGLDLLRAPWPLGLPDVTAVWDSLWADPDYDFKWYPDPLRQDLGSEYPLWVRIHLCPRTIDAENARAQRRDIVSVVSQYGRYFRITLEDRPLAVLALQAGDHIQGALPGTVGGFLQDSGSSQIYGVTCSHVASSGGQVHDRARRLLGTVAHATTLSPSGSQLCRPNAATVNGLDVAMFTVSGGAVACRLSGPTQSYGSGQIANMHGAVSGGPHAYGVGGLGLIHKIYHAGQDYCFKDLFSIRTRLTAPFAFMSAALAVAPVPQQGDSGAWITVQGSASQPAWIGMLIGIDQIEGFAIDADEAQKWASNATNSTLSVY